jgi:hypothetical protein
MTLKAPFVEDHISMLISFSCQVWNYSGNAVSSLRTIWTASSTLSRA